VNLVHSVSILVYYNKVVPHSRNDVRIAASFMTVGPLHNEFPAYDTSGTTAMNASKMISRAIRYVRYLPGVARASRRDYGVKTFSHLPRKSRTQLIKDLMTWRMRTGSIHSDFFRCGLDRQGRGEIEDFVPLQALRDLRNESNRITTRESVSYACLLTDKFVFGQYATSLGYPVPKTIALLHSDRIEWMPDRREESLDCLWKDTLSLDAFCKPIRGGKGQEIFRLTAWGGRVKMNGNEISPSALTAFHYPLIVQERLSQHALLSQLNSSSVNTVRLLTFRDGEEIVAPCAGLRFGVGNTVVDNWDMGGLVAGVCIESGAINTPAYSKSGGGGRTTHPLTGMPLTSLRLPDWTDAVDLSRRLHRDLPGIHSVGWDIAFTTDGPVILEGNAGWDPMLLVLFSPVSIPTYIRTANQFAAQEASPRGN
jgi:hypothetical protein